MKKIFEKPEKRESFDECKDKFEGIFIDPNKSFELKRRFTIDEAKEFIGTDDIEVTQLAVFNKYGIFENEMPPVIHITALSDPVMRESLCYNYAKNVPASVYTPRIGHGTSAAISGRCVLVGDRSGTFLANHSAQKEIVELYQILERDAEEGGGVSGLPDAIPLFRAKSIEESQQYASDLGGIGWQVEFFWNKY